MKKFLLAALMAALCLTGAARPKPKHIVFMVRRRVFSGIDAFHGLPQGRGRMDL